MNSAAHCPHCNAGILVVKGGKAKLRTNIIVMHKSGEVETNCPSCKRSIVLPLSFSPDQPMRKSGASSLRFGVPLDRTNKPVS